MSSEFKSTVVLNPFTAMHAAPSLGKRPIKVPNLRSLRSSSSSLFFFFFFFEGGVGGGGLLYVRVKGFLSKCTVLKVDLL